MYHTARTHTRCAACRHNVDGMLFLLSLLCCILEYTLPVAVHMVRETELGEK